MFIFGLFLGNPHLKNEKKSQSADNKQNFEILVPLRAKHLKPHNNRLIAEFGVTFIKVAMQYVHI